MNTRDSLSTGLRIAAVGITAALLSACGGRSGSGPLPNASNNSHNSGTALVKFHIVVPAAAPKIASSSVRKPNYVASTTASATVTVLPGPVSASCTVSAGSCDGTVSAPIGSDTFTVSLYGVNPPANLLSQGTTTKTIVAGTANSVNVTFNPVVATVSFVPGPLSPELTLGTAGTAHLTVRAVDADGNIIVGPGNFVDGSGNALTFGATVTNDAGSATAFGAVTGTAAAPGDTIALAYTGAVPAFGATLTPTIASGSGTPTLLATSAAPFKATGTQVTETAAAGTPLGLALDPSAAGQVWYGAGDGGINALLALSPALNGVTPGFPVYAAADATDGAVFFTDWGTNADTVDQPTPAAIDRVDLTTHAVTQTTLGAGYTNAVPESIIYDATGVWFAERGFILGGTGGLPPTGAVSAIGKLNPGTSVITQYNVPGNPYGLVIGPDSNIWFTEDWNDKVGVLSTAGTLLHEYQLSGFTGSFANSAKGIASDGTTNLWVATQAGSQIVQIVAADGSHTDYALPDGTYPINLVWVPSLGGKPRLVFTESGTGSIGILDTTHLTPVQAPGYVSPVTTGLTEIQLPSGAASTPTGIVADGTGGFWVTEAGSGKIAHVTGF